LLNFEKQYSGFLLSNQARKQSLECIHSSTAREVVMTQSMKAIRLHQYGDSSVLRYEDAPVPTPNTGEVLIKVYAAGVNPVDWKVRAGYLKERIPYTLPLVPGWDVSGTIVSIGEQVTGWNIGDAVYSRPDIARQGAYAEYIAVRASEISKKPQSLDWVHAAAVPLAALTAWQALFDSAQLKAGERVLIHAGSGGVGIFAVQLAKIRGAHVITTTSTAGGGRSDRPLDCLS
jgi:NADPH:quinone reductase-like Zn-dependent oxidoreductase